MRQKSLNEKIPLFGTTPISKKLPFFAGLFVLGLLYAVYSDYNLSTGSGNLSMVLFLAANTYYPAKRIRIHYNIRNVQGFFDGFLVYHIWINTLSFGVACYHCYITLWSNTWLMIALSLMGWLTVAGFLMWFKYPPAKVRKGMYILHTQQFVFFLMIFAMLKGHYVF